MQLLADLDGEDLLGRLQIEELVTQERLEKALQATKSAEAQLGEGAGGGGAGAGAAAAADAKKGSQKVGKDAAWQVAGKKAKGNKKPPPVTFYELVLDSEALAAIQKLWQAHASEAPPEFRQQPGFHVTLLYLGGKSDEQIASKSPLLGGPAEVAQLRKDLEGKDGSCVAFEIVAVTWDGRIAAAEVAALPSGLCANPIPHITLALKAGVPPSMSNELLARRAANRDLYAHLRHWLSSLELMRYCAATKAWCQSSGAATADEIAENSQDLAAALVPDDEDQRARVRTLLAQSAPGEVHERTLREPLRLRGRVHARRYGN